MGAAVYMASSLEYLIAEIAELAGNSAKDNKRRRIVPRDIQLAIRNDPEIDQLLHNVTIPCAGVVPNIHAVLLPKRSTPKRKHEETEPPRKKKAVEPEEDNDKQNETEENDNEDN